MTMLAKIRKNQREEIRVSRDEFRGHDLISIRAFYEAEGGDMRPGRPGIAFRLDLLSDVLTAFAAANEKDVRHG